MKITPYLKILTIFSLVALALRLYLYQFAMHIDIYSFYLWSVDLVVNGLGSFYSHGSSDYPPGYLYILWLLGKTYYWLLAHYPDLAIISLLYKLPSMGADILSSLIIFLTLQRLASTKKALITSLLYLFNPAIIANSTLWGQIDSFLAFFLLLSTYLLISKRYYLSIFVLGIAQIIKPIAILALPIFLIFIAFKQPKDLSLNLKNLLMHGRTLIPFLILFIITVILPFYPFYPGGNFFDFIIKRHIIAFDWFTFATLNAFNIWTFFSTSSVGGIDKISDQIQIMNISYQNWGRIFFISIYTFILFNFIKKLQTKEKREVVLILSLGLCYLAMFLFFTRMRERHLFYGLSFLLMLIFLGSVKNFLITILLYAIHSLNLYFAYSLSSKYPLILASWMILLFSTLNLFSFGYLMKKFCQIPSSLRTHITN